MNLAVMFKTIRYTDISCAYYDLYDVKFFEHYGKIFCLIGIELNSFLLIYQNEFQSSQLC